MQARSDDVPDFYGTEPVPGEDYDPWASTIFDGCAHAELCTWLAWWVANYEGEEDPDGVASDTILTDGHACGECPFREVEE
ncbi:hypothetical protein DXD59_00745 [Olsenella sp. TM06-36]|jgi:hypothetical protein|nr:hypothetical protein DXD59_00745 [Olsenella sp. TM06-36]RHJ96155.1 hypothetical protein DW092_00740 [Olsenella sp. AM05-7]RHK00411.1 hypothetical protein DW090_01380 [Olsenella sp. AM05-17]